ncbi:MAG: hypothetical protein AUG49_10505 [Catenulispora sp. 13_1_20CM_3_70_7]|nr:MAG: hypothetical protein AUG49_10505 [Catenulispora sp. 13_1_20CM_3_70_7]
MSSAAEIRAASSTASVSICPPNPPLPGPPSTSVPSDTPRAASGIGSATPNGDATATGHTPPM